MFVAPSAWCCIDEAVRIEPHQHAFAGDTRVDARGDLVGVASLVIDGGIDAIGKTSLVRTLAVNGPSADKRLLEARCGLTKRQLIVDLPGDALRNVLSVITPVRVLPAKDVLANLIAFRCAGSNEREG